MWKLLAVVLVIVVACETSGLSTPDVEPEPAYWPTVEDQTIGVEAVVSRLPAGSSGLAKDGLRNAAIHSDAVYVASQCVAGEQMTSNGFRKFTEGALSNRSLPTIAKEAIETILAKADARVLLGLAAAEVGCERAYLYPETGAEARLASDLVAAVVLPRLLPFLTESYLSAPDRRPASWFNMEAPAEKPFLLRFLCRSSCGLSRDALTPEAPTDEPAILVPTPQPGFTPANPFFQTVPIPPTSTPQLPAFLR